MPALEIKNYGITKLVATYLVIALIAGRRPYADPYPPYGQN
ncbi:MAG: hypothetical protein R2867_02855 [Caldilineaceae bacterium]